MSEIVYLVAKAVRLGPGDWVRMRSVKVPTSLRDGFREVEARRSGRQVGYLQLKDSGEVKHVFVAPALRRKKIATQMWRAGERSGMKPSHAGMRSDVGDAWARSTGAPLPQRTGDRATPRPAWNRTRPVAES